MTTNLPTLFEDSDLSQLPTDNPGGNKPWRSSGVTGWQIVVGDFTSASGAHNHDDRYYTESEVDSFVAAKANKSGDTFTGSVVITAPAASTQLKLRMAAGQSADVFRVVNSTESLTYAAIDSVGTFTVQSLKISSNADAIQPSSGMGYMHIVTNTPLRLTGTGVSVYDYYGGSFGALAAGKVTAAQGNFSGEVVTGNAGAFKFGSTGPSLRCTGSRLDILTNNGGATTNVFCNDVTGNSFAFGGNGAVTGTLAVGSTITAGGNVITTQNLTAVSSGTNYQIGVGTGSTGVRMVSDYGVHWTSTPSGSTDIFAGIVDASIVRNAANQLDVRANSGLRLRNLAGNNYSNFACGAAFFGFNATLGATAPIQWSARSALESPADGQLKIGNSGFNAGVLLDVSTDAVLKVRNRANNADAAISAAQGNFSGNLSAGTTTLAGPLNLAPITKATLLAATPNASTGGRWRVTDSTPANREAYPDGTNWRWSSDDTVVT